MAQRKGGHRWPGLLWGGMEDDIEGSAGSIARRPYPAGENERG